MKITRTIQVPVAFDAAGVATTEAEDVEIEVDLKGEDWQGAEPDVGIMSGYYECITATDEDDNVIELTEAEEERAQEILCEDRC